MTHSSSSQRFNLLQIRPIRALIQWPLYPYIFQIIALVVFVTLAIIGWGHFVPEYVNDKLYAKTNIVNLVIWGLWWPLMVWLAVLFGRAWCTVCPLELVANGTERLGRRLGVRQLILGKWLRSGAVIVGLYAIIQLCVAGAHLPKRPKLIVDYAFTGNVPPFPPEVLTVLDGMVCGPAVTVRWAKAVWDANETSGE